SFLTAVTLLLGTSAIINAVKANKYRTIALASSQRAISELCENLDSITVSLQKGLYVSTKPMLTTLSSQLSRSASCAKVSLGQLTSENMITDEIYKFLSQVGDFTSSVSQNAAEDKPLSQEQRQSLKQLYEYSRSLSESIGTIRDGCYDGTISLEKASSLITADNEDESAYYVDSVNDAEQSLADYPTLIYDGPFADSMLERDAEMLKNESVITFSDARKKAAEYLGVKATELKRESDENSKLSMYCFSKSGKTVAVTKQGGYLGYITNPDYSSAVSISEKEAVKKAKAFLEKVGYPSMKESYYSTYDGVCTINFAYEKDGIIYYSDLIKVSVTLDKGTVAAVDARGFLMNHRYRQSVTPAITEKQAREKLADTLIFLNSKLAMIPTKYGGEKLCYELHCKDDSGQEALVYIDVLTGEEEDILLLLYSDGGMLTR
ncbi:MAG: PepSY1/2 domain-containing protein, partial [Acutalibacteraceae bacterium]